MPTSESECEMAPIYLLPIMHIPRYHPRSSSEADNPTEHCHSCPCQCNNKQGQYRFYDGDGEYGSSLSTSSERSSAVTTASSNCEDRSSRLSYSSPCDVTPPHNGGTYGGTHEEGHVNGPKSPVPVSTPSHSRWNDDDDGNADSELEDNRDGDDDYVAEAKANKPSNSSRETITKLRGMKNKCKFSLSKMKESIEQVIWTTISHLSTKKRRPRCAYCGTRKACTCIEDEERERRKYEEEEDAAYAQHLEEERLRQPQHDSRNKYCQCEKCFKKVNARIVRTSKGGRRKYRRVSSRLRGVAGFKISRMAVC